MGRKIRMLKAATRRVNEMLLDRVSPSYIANSHHKILRHICKVIPGETYEEDTTRTQVPEIVKGLVTSVKSTEIYIGIVSITGLDFSKLEDPATISLTVVCEHKKESKPVKLDPSQRVINFGYICLFL